MPRLAATSAIGRPSSSTSQHASHESGKSVQHAAVLLLPKLLRGIRRIGVNDRFTESNNHGRLPAPALVPLVERQRAQPAAERLVRIVGETGQFRDQRSEDFLHQIVGLVAREAGAMGPVVQQRV